MEDATSEKQEEFETKSSISVSIDENGLSTDRTIDDTNSFEHAEEQTETGSNQGNTIESKEDTCENLCPLKTKESSTGAKAKRKVRSTRRKLNAMISNASLHFSDTDSEGELTTINTQLQTLNCTEIDEQRPVISITLENAEGSNLLSPDEKGPSQRNSFVDNLTDVDEIYPSETENDQKDNQSALKVVEGPGQGETDLEDFEGEDEVQSTIYVKPRTDIFCDYSGETVTTKEGDGPFSIEVRNKMYREEVVQDEICGCTPDIVVISNTDEEEIDVSDEEELEEACCSHRDLLEDLDVLAASQVVMKNINKMANVLTVKDASDDAISDCHTDTEDVDPIE